MPAKKTAGPKKPTSDRKTLKMFPEGQPTPYADGEAEKPAAAAPPAGSTADGQPVPPPEKPVLAPVQFEAPHDYQLVAGAIEHRTKSLNALADKANSEEYPRESRVFRNDARRLSEDLRKKFAAQGSLPLATAEHLEDAIVAELRQQVRPFCKPGTSEERLLELLAVQITAYTQAIVEAAFHAGLSYRHTTAEMLGVRHAAALNGKKPE